MTTDSQPIIIYTTCTNQQEAKRLANNMLNKKLVACANLIPQMTAIYRWEGEIHTSQEVSLLLKTMTHHYAACEAYLLAHHSYDTPAIVSVPIDQISPAFARWIEAETS